MSARIVRVLEIVVFPLVWITKKLMLVPALWWKRIGILLAIAPFPLWLWARFFPSHGTLSTTWSYGGDLALFSIWGCVMVLWLLSQFAFDHLAVAIVRRVARLLPVRGTGALALARHTLDSRRAVSRKGYWMSKPDLGSLTMVAVLILGVLAAQTIDGEQERQVEALTFDAIVLPAGASGFANIGPGVDRTELNPEVIAALEADPSLAVVPFAHVTVGPVGATAPTASITLVVPGDLDRVTPDGARPLGFQDGVLLSPDSENDALAFPARPPQVIDVSTGAATATLFHRLWFNPNTFATRSWAEATWGDVPTVGALVTYVGEDMSASDRLSFIDRTAARAGAQARPAPTMSAEDVEYRDTGGALSRGAFGFFAVYFVVLVGFAIIMLSIRTVKKNRQVRATVAALGATPRALAAAVPIDAAISLTVAFIIGAPLGGLVAAIAKHPTLLSPGAPLDPANTAWGLWWNLTHIAWGQMAAVTALTWLVAVTAATVYGLTVARRTPVDELRVAIKEGVS